MLMSVQIRDKRLHIHGQHVSSEDRSRWRTPPPPLAAPAGFLAGSGLPPHRFTLPCPTLLLRLFLTINYAPANFAPSPAFGGTRTAHDRYRTGPRWPVSLNGSRSARGRGALKPSSPRACSAGSALCFDSVSNGHHSKSAWQVLTYLRGMEN